MGAPEPAEDFAVFFAEAEPRLRRAYVGRLPRDEVPDAVSAALEHAWRHWSRVSTMEYPVAYLYRVGRSKSRRRKQGTLPPSPPNEVMTVEPALVTVMQQLPRRQREVVWLVDACGWTPTEAAEALDLSRSAARTHRSRALTRLRRHLGVTVDDWRARRTRLRRRSPGAP